MNHLSPSAKTSFFVSLFASGIALLALAGCIQGGESEEAFESVDQGSRRRGRGVRQQVRSFVVRPSRGRLEGANERVRDHRAPLRGHHAGRSERHVHDAVQRKPLVLRLARCARAGALHVRCTRGRRRQLLVSIMRGEPGFL